MAGYTYTQFTLALASLMAVPNNNVNDANFVVILPTIINVAEQRCYRDLDLIFATNRNTTTLTANLRTLNFAPLAPYLVIVEDVNVITPASVTNPDLGTRNQVTPASKEFIDAVYGGPAPVGVPEYFAMFDDITAFLGPWPDQAYTVEVIGKYRPLPLYDPASAGGSFLSLYLPDLFMAAAMVEAMGWRRNFGAMTDDPRSAISWEQQYTTLLQSAKNEETRKRFHGWGQLSSQSVPPPAPGGP